MKPSASQKHPKSILEDLKASYEKQGPLRKVIRTKFGIASGSTRLQAVESWPIEDRDVESYYEHLKLVVSDNIHAVKDPDWWKSVLKEAALELEKQGVPRGEIASRLRKDFPLSQRTIYRYLSNEFKAQQQSEAGKKGGEKKAEQIRQEIAATMSAGSSVVQTNKSETQSKQNETEQISTETQTEPPKSTTQLTESLSSKSDQNSAATSQAPPAQPPTSSQSPPPKSSTTSKSHEDSKIVSLRELLKAKEEEITNLSRALERLNLVLSRTRPCPQCKADLALAPGESGEFTLVAIPNGGSRDVDKSNSETPKTDGEPSQIPKSLQNYSLREVAEGCDTRGGWSQWTITVNGDGRTEAKLSLSQRGGILLTYTDSSLKPVQKPTLRELIETLAMGPIRGLIAVNLAKLEDSIR